MKMQRFLALAGLLPLAALAQSNITLAGVVDSGVRIVKNENLGSVKSVVSGSNSTSKITVRGVEELGGGMAASFYLEHGLTADNGAQVSSTMFWDRRSTVSLSHNSFGEIRLGRDYVPNFINWVRFDPFAYVGAAHTGNLVSATPNGPIRSAFAANPNTTVRSNNAVQYFLPSGLGGIEGSLMVAVGEGGTAANGQYRLTGGRFGYASGPVVVWASVSHTTVGGTAPKFKDVAVAGSYDAKVLKVSAGWRRFEHSTTSQDNLLIGLWVPVGVGEIKASYTNADMKGRVGATAVDANDASQISLGYIHTLSKRTAVYAHAVQINNKGAATFVVPGGPAGLVGGTSSRGFEAGLRHSF